MRFHSTGGGNLQCVVTFCFVNAPNLIVPQPEVGLLLSWPGNICYSTFLYLCGQIMPIIPIARSVGVVYIS